MKFDYLNVRGKFLPIIPIEIKGKKEWVQLRAFADSGATQSIFHSEFADVLGIILEKGKRFNIMVGDGSFIPIFSHKLDVKFAGEKFKAEIGFSKRLGVEFNILGRKDFFDRFVFSFDDYHKILEVLKIMR